MDDSRLPAVPVPDFNLIPGEALAGGLRRLSLEQFDVALTGLRAQSASRDVAIHEMRKASKRIRALLRMVRPAIGERVFKAENGALRDAARLVSGVRDGAVLVDAVGRMRSRYGHLLAPGVFVDLEDRLRRRHQRMVGRVLDDDEVMEQVVGELHRARSRYAAWPVELEDPSFPSSQWPQTDQKQLLVDRPRDRRHVPRRTEANEIGDSRTDSRALP